VPSLLTIARHPPNWLRTAGYWLPATGYWLLATVRGGVPRRLRWGSDGAAEEKGKGEGYTEPLAHRGWRCAPAGERGKLRIPACANALHAYRGAEASSGLPV